MLRPAFLAALAACFAVPGPARAAEALNNCAGFIDALPAVISTPGTWCLRRNVTSAITSGAAITIEADDVTLDCNRFSMTGAGPDASSATGVVALSNDNTTVRRCNVRGFGTGMQIYGSANLLEDNRLENNRVGAYVVQEYGFGTAYTRGISTIRRNQAIDSRGAGISTYGWVEVSDNIVDGVDGSAEGAAEVTGILAELAAGGVFARNVVRNVTVAGGEARGIHIGNFGPSVLVRDNVVIAMPGALSSIGIHCFGSGSVVGNQVSGWDSAIVGCSAQHDNDIVD